MLIVDHRFELIVSLSHSVVIVYLRFQFVEIYVICVRINTGMKKLIRYCMSIMPFIVQSLLYDHIFSAKKVN